MSRGHLKGLIIVLSRKLASMSAHRVNSASRPMALDHVPDLPIIRIVEIRKARQSVL
jgi:hypothetical protein